MIKYLKTQLFVNTVVENLFIPLVEYALVNLDADRHAEYVDEQVERLAARTQKFVQRNEKLRAQVLGE